MREMRENESQFYMGNCPICKSEPVLLNVGKMHYLKCPVHPVCWEGGRNMLASYMDETEETWDENLKTLCTCYIVDPLNLDCDQHGYYKIPMTPTQCYTEFIKWLWVAKNSLLEKGTTRG